MIYFYRAWPGKLLASGPAIGYTPIPLYLEIRRKLFSDILFYPAVAVATPFTSKQTEARYYSMPD
jgi:hypothetical protein